MIVNMTMFNSEEELMKITNLDTFEKLYKAGFDADDISLGFCADKDFSVLNDGYILERWMDDYCIGYTKTKYNGKYYFLMHHG